MAEKYMASQPPKAKYFAEESFALANELNFLRGKIIALNKLSDYHFRQSNYANAVDYATQALRMATQAKDSLLMADSYRLLGNTNTFGLKQYDQALDYQQKALEIYERRNDKGRMAALYGSITWIYAITNKHIMEAHQLADKGILISRELKNYQMLSYNYNSKGLLFFKEEKFDSALVSLRLSSVAAERVNDKAVISFNKSIIGYVFFRQKKYLQAVEIYEQALKEGKQLNVREVEKEAYAGLSKAYAALRQYDLAYDFHVKYVQLKDSLVNWETTQKTIAFRIGYEEEKKEAKIIQLESENRLAKSEKRNYIIFFSTLFLLFLAVIGSVISNNRQRRVANILLKEKNEEIETQNEELHQSREEITTQRDLVSGQNNQLKQVNFTKDKLFSIIGHDLRGPIASLKALLSLVARNEVTGDELKMLTPRLNQSVGSLQEMLENLLHWSRSQMEGLKSSPRQLDLSLEVEKVLLLFVEAASIKNISISCHIESTLKVFADENHVSLIFRNLINNAIKFTPKNGTIKITASRQDEFVEIVIADSGIGISSDRLARLFEVNVHYTSQGTQGEKGTGLGLLLCKEMAEANGGRIAASSELEKGSIFYVYLKATA